MKKYNVIYADPPWSYKNKKTGATMKSGSLENYKSVMSLEDICNMPIKDITDKNAVLFIWVTVPLLPDALKVIDAWGFKYKTMLTWRKIMSLGMGYWYRGQCEHLILATKGKVKAFRMQTPNFYQCKAGKHSQKPHYFRELINDSVINSFDSCEKLELFARDRNDMFPDYEYEGWDVYGNECKNSIEL